MKYTRKDIAKTIDTSLLSPTLTIEQLEAGCRMARECDAASACIMPFYLRRCAEVFSGSTVKFLVIYIVFLGKIQGGLGQTFIHKHKRVKHIFRYIQS